MSKNKNPKKRKERRIKQRAKTASPLLILLKGLIILEKMKPTREAHETVQNSQRRILYPHFVPPDHLPRPGANKPCNCSSMYPNTTNPIKSHPPSPTSANQQQQPSSSSSPSEAPQGCKMCPLGCLQVTYNQANMFQQDPKKANVHLCRTCLTDCLDCQSMRTCTTCKQGFYNYKNMQCQKCQAENCRLCHESNSTCSTCFRGFFLTEDRLCGQCVDNCAECTSLEECGECVPYYRWNNVTRRCEIEASWVSFCLFFVYLMIPVCLFFCICFCLFCCKLEGRESMIGSFGDGGNFYAPGRVMLVEKEKKKKKSRKRKRRKKKGYESGSEGSEDEAQEG